MWQRRLTILADRGPAIKSENTLSLENCRNARERWGGVSELIDRWPHSRQNWLVIDYSELAAVNEFSDNDPSHA